MGLVTREGIKRRGKRFRERKEGTAWAVPEAKWSCSSKASMASPLTNSQMLSPAIEILTGPLAEGT